MDLDFHPEMSSLTARSHTPTLKYWWLRGSSCFGGREIVRNMCTFQGSPDWRESVQVLSKNNPPINRVVSKNSVAGLGGREVGRTRCSHKDSKVTRAPLGQHTCFLSSESARFPVFSSWKKDPKPIFMFRLKLMQTKLSNANLAARISGRISSDSGVCFHEEV